MVEHVLRIKAQMPSRPVAEDMSRSIRNLFTFSGGKLTMLKWQWVREDKEGIGRNGFGTLTLEANTKFKHSAFSYAESTAEQLSIVRECYTPDTDFTRLHQSWKKENLSW